MDYLLAAESLAYFVASLSLFAVWREPTKERLSFAALAIGLCFALKGFRISIALVLLHAIAG